MTVLHSRNADAADPADVADAADVKDPQDAAAEPDLREDLGRYAELGAFTLSADTHAWYAAVDTVATPEDARAASTALAELRGRDLQQTWEAVTALAADVKLDEPDTVAKTVLLVEMLQRVRRTSAILTSAAYDADLVALAAATADSTWRRENGVKLSWLRGRSLRKQATALAHERKVRREDLHEALTSAEIERRAWAAIAPAGTLPNVPADGDLVERTAQAFEPINTGLRDLARLLPDHDLDGLAFTELADLVERLAADEGTLYRLPTIRGLRATLEEAGLADLLAELTAAKADRRAAEAAYAARQALAGGQRDGLAAPVAEEAEVAGEVADDVSVEAEAETETEVEPSGAEPSQEEAEAAARQALAGGQRDGLTEETPAPVAVPVEETAETAEAAAEVDAAAAAAAENEVEVEAEAEAVEAASGADADAAETESAAVEEEEAPAAVVSLPAPSPAADDLVAAATAALAEAAAADEVAAEPEAVEEPAAEIVVEAEVEPEAVAEVPAVEAAEPEVVAVVEVDESPVEVEAEVEAAEEVPAVVAENPAAEAEEPDLVVEAPAAEVAEPVVEAEVAEEAPAVVAEEPEVIAEAPPVEAEAVEVEEPAVEAEAVEVDEPAVEAEEPEVVAEVVAPEPEAEPVAEVPAARSEKPDFTPGRPVTAYSAEELLAVVRWIDADGTGRSDDELLRAAMKELGFARLGPRIKEALGAAVAAARG
ncbi:hypothetical protein [Streptomyces sp. CBMA123]|uniref:hypothetical protein n=1 Tax=Streptomyces sp. CBMA123 TaxID=1896313 RepID=UPI001661D8CD|nr:hypothetical protein [Streptomyces sp. CBMA123]MBD0689287.1 hypothetical protein [Streptomyces sp. CBMA123]